MTTTLARWRMHGGIHPPENKHVSNQHRIRTLALPPQLIIPLQQHIGEEARPIVRVGQQVLKGEKIAEVRALVAAPIHAPTSGTIHDIGLYPTGHASQLPIPCIVLIPDGRDQWITHTGLVDYRHTTSSTLLALIREAGIAGMGGAGFPTGTKLEQASKQPIDIVIINGMECEPYITADDVLMRERAAAIIQGGEIVRHLLGAKRLIIGVEDNKPDAIAALEHAQTANVDIIVAPTRYPSGAARQTVWLLTGRETPASGRTTDVGVFCLNTATAEAIYQAITHGKPSISRITTVTGAAVSQAGNYELLLGTPIAYVLQQCQTDLAQLHRVVIGGPLMGDTINELQAPISKTTNCIIAATVAEFPPPPSEQPCIRCRACVDVCPVQLLPQQLLWFIQHEQFDKAENHQLDACIECGACAYVCPSAIPLVQYYRHGKGELADAKTQAEQAERARIRFEARKQRQAQEEADKEARRLARQQAAAQAAAQSSATHNANAAPTDKKALTIAAALARSNVKKAEKRLAAATTDEERQQLEAEVNRLKAELAQIDHALQQAS